MKKITKGKRCRVRFHLAKGEHYRHWQVKDIYGHTHYFDPHHVCLVMWNAKLVNDRRTALRIMEGEAKQVCAAIDCDSLDVVGWHDQDARRQAWGKHMMKATKASAYCELSYNPRECVHWRYAEPDSEHEHMRADLDDTEYNTVVTQSTGVFAVRND